MTTNANPANDVSPLPAWRRLAAKTCLILGVGGTCVFGAKAFYHLGHAAAEDFGIVSRPATTGVLFMSEHKEAAAISFLGMAGSGIAGSLGAAAFTLCHRRKTTNTPS